MVKKILMAVMITSGLFALDTDKKKHVMVTTAISFTASSIAYNKGFTHTESFWIGLGSALLVGLGKELSDDKFSGKDMLADTVGGVIGTLSLFVYKF